MEMEHFQYLELSSFVIQAHISNGNFSQFMYTRA
jgi:hypothetical protein